MPINPVAFTEKVVSDFLRYQITAYPFADRDLYQQMRRLLSLEETRRTPLLKGPYVSLSRPFRRGARVRDLVSRGILHPRMEHLVKYQRVHGHQEEAIAHVAAGRTTLVSTGTGSGKTESFLYPVVSRCLDLGDRKADPGIVAILVYPMNALAEDQLGRLRDMLAGTGVTFGMYVGTTPERAEDVKGPRGRAGESREDYRARVEAARAAKARVAVHPAEERPSRQELRASPPRILLTNVKQLELLLTRQQDVEMFDGARFEFLVFDEAHTFRGALGAETACLVRRLRAFCGKGPRDTACIATSATLADPVHGLEAGRTFAARFFGVAAEDVTLVGEQYEPDLWAPEGVRTPSPLAPPEPAELLRQALSAVEDASEDGRAVSRVYRSLAGADLDAGRWRDDLFARMAASDLVVHLSEALAEPRDLAELTRDLGARLGRAISEEEVLLWLTLGAAARDGERPLLRPVVHAFVRGVGGAVVSLPAAEERPRLWLSAEDQESGRSGTTPAVRLPVLTCTTCGQHYFEHFVKDFRFTAGAPEGGDSKDEGRYWPALSHANKGCRVVLTDRRVADDDGDDDDASARLAPVWLCRDCGALHPGRHEGLGVGCLGCSSKEALVSLHAAAQKEETPGKLARCVSCGSLGRSLGSEYREPARPVRAVATADVHVLAQDMVHHAENRRLLVFADSRQDAAFQAGWMRDHARRFRLRSLMAERLAEGALSVGDLTAWLDGRLEQDEELSRALLPEVWNVHRKEAQGLKHAQERKRFLRIQVLREVTTSIQQRVGLEPWGRLRVEYAGLDAEHPSFRRHASALGIPKDRLADGIASLLDQMRRNRLAVYDPEDRVFSRTWEEGDFEVMWGYLPLLKGVPRGMKRERDADDNPRWVHQWWSPRGDSVVKQAARKWGVGKDAAPDFVADLFRTLEEVGVLKPVTLTNHRGRTLPRCSGVRQIDADILKLHGHRGVWRCGRCRRAQARPAPFDRCVAWRCEGTLAFEAENPDDYDLAALDGGFEMIRPREHSAQVPDDEREALERAFKDGSSGVNTLVCTPTLEMGLDIGGLDTVLLRNVPPLPSNYWQRVGRAGRRHRMAVNVTYARATQRDRAYFAEPEKMLRGRVDPPRFNLRNEPMVRKHVHATVLTRLQRLAGRGSPLASEAMDELRDAIARTIPPRIGSYLFDDAGLVRTRPFDVSPLRMVVSRHAADLVEHVRRVFAQGWPAVDGDVVEAGRLGACVEGLADQLDGVIRTLRKRLDWALDQMERLEVVRHRKGTLEPDEEALYKRADLLVKRLKGSRRRTRREGEGHDDTATYGVLAAEGFLPGYGLEVGSVVGFAQIPRHLADRPDFDLPRMPAIAIREYVPGNLIYANGHRFVPRYFHFERLEQPTLFQVDGKGSAIVEVGVHDRAGGTAVASTLGASALWAVPLGDVDLVHTSHITDDELYRFQLPVTTLAYELGRHGEGTAFGWGPRAVHFRKGVHFRIVDVGASTLVESKGRLGFPVCLVCGQSRSPFASKAELDHFQGSHEERCGRRPDPAGFFADVVADALTLPGCRDAEEGYSLVEALRMGAANVLEMEREDLAVQIVGRPGVKEVDALLYDPMPGGSGLLEQLRDRFSEVAAAARHVADACPAGCRRACIDCMLTFRNAWFHRSLDRKVVVREVDARGDTLVFAHDIPARLPKAPDAPGERPVGNPEARLREMLERAGFPVPEGHKEIALGRPLGTTRPDAFYPVEDEMDVCIYLDGMSGRIHGDPERRVMDLRIREELRSRGYEVISITVTELSDREAMRGHLFRLGKALLAKERAKQIRDEARWFDEPTGEEAPRPDAADSRPALAPVLPFRKVDPRPEDRYRTCLPVLNLKAAAGGFGGSQGVEPEGWVEPTTRRPLRPGLFVAQVTGRSMEPRIPAGSWNLFAAPVSGPLDGRILLVQHRSLNDPETGGTYTLKRYESEVVASRAGDDEDGGTETRAVRLRSINPEFPPVVLEGLGEAELRVVAEWVEVLGG